MNFSQKVKEELVDKISNANHCRIAEISAILSLCGNVLIDENNQYALAVRTETEMTARKMYHLLRKTFRIEAEYAEKVSAYSKSQRTYIVTIEDHEEAMRVLQATKLIREDGEIEENLSITNNIVIKKECCKRAFIRGAFMAAGSISDPSKGYHFEISCNSDGKSIQLINLLEYFQIDAKVVARKGKFVVYIKEGEGIVDVLNVMEAPIALMEMENIRILKDMSNYYNRQVNCETANIKKTVTTACRQIEDIQFIMKVKGINYLPEKLQDIAQMRIEHPDVPLQELGTMMTPPLGKSGVNHRLRKISQIADELRGT
ncbi:MAG: DNA-binding protein WhiA [Eubacterium sp.]|nr:DNA-binding protein WhiA [Eubacterium sp.]